MAERENSTICGLPRRVPISENDTASLVSDIMLCVINVPLSIFAFLANLAVVIAIVKMISLQRPCNILVCSLAIVDCLTGLIAQPIYVAWRLTMIHRIHVQCDHVKELFTAFVACKLFFVGLSLVYLTLVSLDRLFALAKPMEYRARARKKGKNLDK